MENFQQMVKQLITAGLREVKEDEASTYVDCVKAGP